MAASPKTRVATTIGPSGEARTVEAAKTARLRALRLAKEAEDQEAKRSSLAVPAKRKRKLTLTRSRPASNSGQPNKASEVG